MFGLTPVTLWLILGLVFTNLATVVAWRVTDARLESAATEITACAARHEAFVAQTKDQGQVAAEKATQENLKNEQLSESVTKGWAAAVVAVRADRDNLNKRLRNAEARRNPGGSGVSAPPQNPPGYAQAYADPIPAPERVAADCAETTVTANFLQTFIEQQSEAAKP